MDGDRTDAPGSAGRWAEAGAPYLIPPDDLEGVVGVDQPAFRSRQLREWLYRHPVLRPAEMTNLPGAFRRELEGHLWPFEVGEHQVSDRGTTYKWLFRMGDGAAVETVAMGYRSRTTLCVSSQAGCALACTFCATGQFGFDRHLAAGEIVAQLAYANAFLRSHPLRGPLPGWATWCSWGWASPWPTTRGCGRRSV